MGTRHTRGKAGDFETHTLANEFVSITMVPELGGRIVSLRDRLSRREWLDGWSPAAKRRLWHPADPAEYETGPGAGIDECLPTVLPCELRSGAVLGDHGELWNQRPRLELEPGVDPAMVCCWELKSLPLVFERRVSLAGKEVRFEYRIENLADAAVPFLWAWHPLFTWRAGDRILSAETTCLTTDGRRLPWPEIEAGADLSRAAFPKDSTPAAKVFLGPMSSGRAAIRAKNGARLQLEWPVEMFPFAGIWITRGFWKGLHHWAIEPTNAPMDRLSEVKADGTDAGRTLLSSREVRIWSLEIRLNQRDDF